VEIETPLQSERPRLRESGH